MTTSATIEAALPNPAIANGPADDPCRAQLLSLLAEDGIVISQLAENENIDTNHKITSRALQERVRMLRLTVESAAGPVGPATILYAQETYKIGDCSQQHLLSAGLIWSVWPAYVDDHLFERAMSSLCHELQLCEDLLGGLLPTHLRDAAILQLAANAYMECEGADLRYKDDVSVYLYLRQRRISEPTNLIGIPTGIVPLDAATRGLSGLTFVGGAAGAGKTDLAVEIVCNTLKTQDHTAVLFLELDLSKDLLLDRIACNLERITEAELLAKNLPAERRAAVERSDDTLRYMSDRIDVMSHSAGQVFDVDRFLTQIRQLKHRSGCSRLLVVIDFLQLIDFGDDSGDSLQLDRARMDALTTIRRACSSGNTDADDVFLVISEVRKTDRDQDLVLADLMGAARLQYVADNVLMLQNLREGQATDEITPVELLVVKTRRGHRTRIPLNFLFRRHAFAAMTVPPQRADAAAGTARRSRKSH